VQFFSVGIALGFLIALGLATALAITFASPIIAFAIFLIAFGAFLAWRATKREERRGEYAPRGVPTTSETAADPVADSGVGQASTTGGPARGNRERDRTRA
jgi:hypothetical protein